VVVNQQYVKNRQIFGIFSIHCTPSGSFGDSGVVV
jgi:hypothetical protein